MYNIWFCEIIEMNQNKINGLCYEKLLYKDIKENELLDYAKYICNDYGVNFIKIEENKYVRFNHPYQDKENEINKNYCFFFEELCD